MPRGLGKRKIGLQEAAIIVSAAAVPALWFLSGWVYAVGALAVALGLSVRKFYSKEVTLEILGERKQQLLNEIRTAESKWRKRKISEKVFEEMNEENQQKLVALEAEIELKKVEENINRTVHEKAAELTESEKAQLETLLKEKEILLRQAKVAKKKYLKRKLDEKTYRSISTVQQKKLIVIETKIKMLYRAEARKIMEKAREELARAELRMTAKEKETLLREIGEQV